MHNQDSARPICYLCGERCYVAHFTHGPLPGLPDKGDVYYHPACARKPESVFTADLTITFPNESGSIQRILTAEELKLNWPFLYAAARHFNDFTITIRDKHECDATYHVLVTGRSTNVR